MEQRSAQIMRASIVNIAGNLLLAVFKGVIGQLTHSIAITLDAVNNVTDGISSIITIVGTKLAERPASHEHPFGFGRMEYVATTVISALIIGAGGASLVESVRLIINPNEPSFTIPLIIILCAGCAVKLGLGLFLRHKGQSIDAGTLVASGTDALMDSCVSAGTIAAALIHLFLGVNIEAWLALAIAVLIVKSGFELLLETLSKIMGERVDAEVSSQVERCAREIDGVLFASNLVLQDHGPNRLSGSIYLTVDGHMDVAEFDRIARSVQKRVAQESDVQLDCIGVYPANAPHDGDKSVRSVLGGIVLGKENVVEIRGLYLNAEQHIARFDAITGFGGNDPEELRAELIEQCRRELPTWEFDINVFREKGD